MPDFMSFDDAAVLPVSISIASAAMFTNEYLALPLPSLSPTPTGTTMLLWDGSSSVGCSAIQLARAAGVEVITTASPHNFELCKSLGAGHVFDHHDPSIVHDIADALENKTFVGAFDAIATIDTIKACVEVIANIKANKMIVTTVPPMQEFDKKGVEMKPGRSFCYRINENQVWIC